MNPLQVRLAALRRRLRFVVTFRGVCWLGSLLLFAIALAGLLDWRVHLPGAVRALVLAGTLGGAGYVLLRFLMAPLLARTDDLALALQVEARFPELNDALASAVQFLERAPLAAETSPPTLRSEAVRRALDQVEGHDFATVVDERGVRPAWISCMAGGCLALVLVVWQPALARTALLRLADPFGGHDWPRQTQLAVHAADRAARGEAFVIRANVRGVLPEKAAISYRFADESRLEQTCEIQHSGKAEEGMLTTRLEPERVQQPFRFQVRANDAVSEWRSVAVFPPPLLAPLDGRPSPQVHLRHPAYSDLPDLDLPDGATSVEALAGTVVTLRAATDRPIARAWLEFPPELTPLLDHAAALAAVNSSPFQAAFLASNRARSVSEDEPFALANASGSVWRIPALVQRDGRSFTLEFVARISAVFVLHLEDETGLGSSRLFEVRLISDPVPAVQLDRPSKAHDSFDVLAGAEITLQLLAEDVQFALRSVWLEYQITGADNTLSRMGRLPGYDHATAGRTAAALAGLPPGIFRLRQQRMEVGRRWSLRPLNLKEGEMVRLQAFADDFDDVMVGKPPGRSHEVELRVVGRTTLERLLHEAQMHVQQELQRLARLQQDALKNVISAEAVLSNRGKLEPKQIDEIVQAEQMQQQLRARVGNPMEGLRAEVARILQTMRDNDMPRAGAHERMELTAAQLQRLAREHLDQVEPRLTETRKDQESGTAPSASKDRNPLSEARKHQEEIRRTLQNLLKLLEPWSSTSEVKGEARLLLEEQKKLTRETDRLSQEVPPGTSRADLRKEQEKLENEAILQRKLTEERRKQLDQLKQQQAALDRNAELQNKLAERFEELLNKLERAATGNAKDAAKATDPESAKELREAAQQARKANIAGEMRGAEQSVRDGSLGKARDQQRRSTQGLEEMVQALEERREAELERLRKKLKAAEEQVGKLSEAQEQLRKKTQKAAEQADPRDRARELRRLAREQEQLQKQVEEALQELTRLRRPEAQQSVAQAGQRMEQATRRMEEGASPDAQQQDALDKLDEARRDLEEARQAIEEELIRERLAKLADQIKGLKEQQESRLEESARIHRDVLQRKQWTRGLLTSLRELGRAQEHLAKETAGLADGKAAGAEVFAHLLRRSAAAMEQAAQRVRQRAEEALRSESPESGLDLRAENGADEEVQQLQRQAVRLFEHLLEALKPDPNMPRGRSGKNGGGQGGGDGGGSQGGGGGRRGPGEGISPVAELKALKGLQQDLNDRTRAFAEKHPEPNKRTEKEIAELAGLRQEQQKITELLHKITSVRMPEGEKP